jgi:hypothetical protein
MNSQIRYLTVILRFLLIQKMMHFVLNAFNMEFSRLSLVNPIEVMYCRTTFRLDKVVSSFSSLILILNQSESDIKKQNQK